MGLLSGGFKADEQEKMSFDPLEPGEYKVVIAKTEERSSTKGGQYLMIEFSVVGSSGNGRKIWVNYNLVNDNPTAVKIAKSELAELCKAVGKPSIMDANELLNLPFIAEVGIRVNKETGDKSNNIKKYKSIDSASTSPASTSASTGNKAPWAKK